MSQPNNRSKKVIRAVVAILLITGSLIWWFFLRGSNTPREIISVSGRIESDDAAVAAKTSGRIREITVREGDQVKAGQVIATLDDEQVKARVDQAQSNVAQAEARLSRARHEIAVLQAQLEQSRLGVNQSRMDAEGRVSQAQAHVAAAEASLARADADYKQARADAERFTTLAEQGDAPAREGEQARAAAEAHKAVVQAARKQVEAARGGFLAAKANLDNPAIRAAQSAAIEQQIRQAEADVQSAEAEAGRARAQLQEAEAVRGVDLEIGRGEIFGVIGPDGAGKTSVFQILGGVMAATAGEALIFGRTSREARSVVGYLTQAFSLYQDLSVAENLRYVGRLRKLSDSQIAERGMHYLKLFDMDRFTGRLAGKLSGGMKQKLALACALITEPKVLLLDEPTTGVDPVSRREFWDTLAGLSADGMTIVVATPYLDEAERCARVSLMQDGLIHQTGAPAEIRERLGLRRLEVRASELSRAEEALGEVAEIADVQRFGDRLDVMAKDIRLGERVVRDALGSAKIEVREISAGSPTLENAFVSILRDLQGEMKTPPFPERREFRKRAPGAIAIGARSLHKRFGAFHAVKDINIEVKYGEIYGLLGANGAGKTTTIKILCGLLAPSGGEMELAGERGSLRSSFVRRRVGYMSQKFSLYDDLTINDNLDFFAGVYGVPPEEREEKKRWVLEFSGLSGRGEMPTGKLPGGWKQRVAFGATIMHEPSVLFLDEPTSGVDPLARRAFWRMINQLADRGVAVLVTTHYLEEAEQCNRLGFMVAGELVAEGAPSGIKAAQRGHLIELITDHPQSAADLLKGEMDRWRVSLFGDRLHVIIDDEPSAGICGLRRRLESRGVQVFQAYEERYSLEDVFIAVVEQARRNGKVAAGD